MDPSSTLSVWSYASTQGAHGGLRVLERLQTRKRLVIDDCAVVEWPVGHPRPATYQAGIVDGEPLLSGAFWGMFFGLLYLAPLAGLPDGPPDSLAGIGLPDPMLRQVRDLTPPGASALFVVSSTHILDQIHTALSPDASRPAPTCVSTQLGPDEEAALRRGFGNDTARTRGAGCPAGVGRRIAGPRPAR